MKYTETSGWENVGSASISAGDAKYCKIAIDNNGVPYVVYKDNANSLKATVMKYSSGAWNLVGNAGFSTENAEASHTSIAIDSNCIPYVVYQKYSGSYKATVMKFAP